MSAHKKLKVADISYRIVAGIGDIFFSLILVGFVVLVSLAPVFRFSFDTKFSHRFITICGFAGFFSIFIGSFLSRALFLYLEYKYGKTPGKYLMGITVVSEDGKPLRFLQVIVRYAVWLVESLAYGLPALIAMIVDDKNRRLGDMAAKTIVVQDELQDTED